MLRFAALLFSLCAFAGERVMLFVDDADIASRQGLVRRIHAGAKLPQPVLVPEKPWEGGRVYLYGTVHYDAATGQFRMWYMSRIGRGQERRAPGAGVDQADFVNLATSRDGVHWERPNLGLYEFDGSRANNIVFGMHSPSVIVDSAEPNPEYRYKMAGVGGPTRKYWAAFSPDGVHWKSYPKNPIIDFNDTITATRDPATGRYLAFHKRPAEVRGRNRRVVWLAASNDFQHWSDGHLILAPDLEDDKWCTRPVENTQFYDMSGFPYAGRFLGLLAVLRVTAVNPAVREIQGEQPSPTDGPLEIQLTHSRNGLTWNRCEDRTPLIAPGPKGSFDFGGALGTANPLVVVGGEQFVYYTAMSTTHGGALPEKRLTIGRAAWRLDGFVSLDAASTGVLETVALPKGVKRVAVNAEAEGGSIVVEAVDARGRVAATSRAINGNGVRQPVRWKTQPALNGAHLRIRMRAAKLYSVRFE